MEIRGFFRKEDNAAYVITTLLSKELNIHSPVRFLIDTGASRTIISDMDAIKLGIDHSLLPRFKAVTAGIGGVVDTYFIQNVKSIFKTQEGAHVEKMEEIFVLKHKIRDERIKRIPSLLGRDILNRYQLLLDRRSNKVVITDTL
ncbi:MAG: retroviral-like aspartic protease family protein [candidate division Zixibacteria bacterium]|nr:retroviral-like aspartic protease family protein [candidate division Zixibacteria bacterium]